MAKTNTESIRELDRWVATLSERVENLRRELDRSEAQFNQRLERLEKDFEESERRRWQLTMAFIGAILSLAVGVVLSLFRK